MNHPMGPRTYLWIVFVALAAAAVTPARATDASGPDQTFFTADPSAPELANDYLRSHPGDAIDVLTSGQPGQDATQIFHAYGPVSRSRAGVCRFTATQIFAHRSDDGSVSWDRTPSNPREHAEPPFIMAAVAANPCPRQNDDSYASLDTGIADAQFVAVTKFWQGIAKSQTKFDEATVYLSLIVSPKTAEQFAAFRSMVFGDAAHVPELQAVFLGGLDAYDLAFGDGRSNSSNFFLSISKSATGFQVLNFQTQY